MEESQDFSLCGKPVLTEDNLRDDYYWKLVADFIGPQSGEGLDLDTGSCKNRTMIQVGLLREDNNFPWIAVISWLKKIFPGHQSADFRRLIERGIAATLSLGVEARSSFLESEVNFDFVGPICDSIGVERPHLLELRDFSDRARSIEVTNGLILELSDFISREKISPVVIVAWLKNFDPDFCKRGDIQRGYKEVKGKIKQLKMYCHNHETRSHRRNVAMETLLQTPFELVARKEPKVLPKRRKRDDFEKVTVKEEGESVEEFQNEGQVEDDDSSGEDDEEESSPDKAEALTLLDIAMLSAQKLSSVYGGKTPACKRVSLDLLKNQYALTCKENPSMVEFERKLNELRADARLVSPPEFLNYNANFLVDVHDALERHVSDFEKELVRTRGERLGRDKLPKFKNFVNINESATSRYVHMASDVLCPRSPDGRNSRKHWLAFCQEKGNPSRLVRNRSNRFYSYMEATAGLVHHHREIPPFFSDLLSMTNDEFPNIVLESVAADADDPVIQSVVCVLAIVYLKVLGPYWQLLKSRGEYSRFGRYLLRLYQKFLDWSKDPSALLEPEESTNVFLQAPLQERNFPGVFHYCGLWHVNRDLIRAGLKKAIKAVAAVTEEHLKDFLPGGIFSEAPPTEASQRLASCTFSVLMAEYPFGHAYPYRKKRSDVSQDEASEASSESSGELAPREEIPEESPPKKSTEKIPEEVVENNDPDYIMAMVTKNGGPCRTQQDLDKMMLRFDGMSRQEKREGIRCEIVYQKTILENNSPHLDAAFRNATDMTLKLKLSLPRVKPGYSLVLAPPPVRARRGARAPPPPLAVAPIENDGGKPSV